MSYERKIKIKSFIASNNQLIFDFRTTLSTLILLHVRDASGMSLWSTCPMRGKNGGVRAVLPAESPESSYCTRGATFDEKQTARQPLVTLPHSRGVGVLFDEVWVVYISARDEELMNSSLLQ